MDLQVEIKEEPAWCEGESVIPVENVKLVRDMKPLKQVSTSVLTEPGPTQENTFELSTDIKEEISIDQHVIKELVAHIKQENNVVNTGVLTVPTGKQRHGCKMCSRTFAKEFNLNKHMLLAHSAEMPGHCAICDATFESGNALKRHMLSHSRGRLLACKECSRCSTQRVSLGEGTAVSPYSSQDFIKLMAREKPYTCPDCERGSRESNSTFIREVLQRPIVVHSGETPFRCNVCYRTFTQRSTLGAHMQNHFRVRP